MIKYNDNTINKWYHDGELIKVYYHDAVCYYKLTPGGQTPCFAVVASISQYSDREFVDVFNQADGKWYKLNNLSAYEEYGVYDSTTATTYYEGKLTVDNGYEYQYSGSSWVNVGEVSGSTASLPDVPFVLNYNAKNYDATNNLIPQTNGQTKEVDAICNSNPNNIVNHSEDGYISVTGDTRLAISGGTESLGRSNTQNGCTMTIVSKALGKGSNSSNYSLFTCRGSAGVSNLCWMYRQYTDYVRLHGKVDSPTLSCSSSNPSVLSVKTYYDGGVKSLVKNWTDNTTTSSSYQYYNNYTNGALFCDYLTYNAEFWRGDFYWLYMSHEVLTDEQIQQVIDYNEEGGGQTEYPVYYDEIQAPPDNVSFSSMTEAEEYECPWVGMRATIAGDRYVFSGDSQSGYEWVYNPSRLPVGYTEVEYIQNTGTSYLDTAIKVKGTYKIEAEMQQVTETNYGRLFGCGAWDGTYGLQFAYQEKCIFMHFFGTSGWNANTSFAFDYLKHTYTYNDGVFSIDSSQAGASTSSTGYTAQDNLGVFTYIASGRPSSSSYWGQEHMKGKMYSFKIWDENDTLVRDLVPCIKDSNNTVGAYDIVNDVFYTVPTGYTTDKLIAGDPV